MGIRTLLAGRRHPLRQPPATAADADLILHNGKIVTVEPRFRLSKRLPSRTAASSRWAARPTCSPANAGRKPSHRSQRTVRAARADGHTRSSARSGLSEHITPFAVLRSFDDIRNYIRQQAAKTPEGEWIQVPKTFPGRLAEMRCRIARCSMPHLDTACSTSELRVRRKLDRLKRAGSRRTPQSAGLADCQRRERGAERHSRRPRFIFD